MTFISIQKNFDIQNNFWELNPQLAVMYPYSLLYGKKNGSEMMWCIFFMSDPDPTVNKFAHFGSEETFNKLVESGYANVKFKEDADFVKCLDSYPFDIMTAAELTLKTEIESLKSRNRILDSLQKRALMSIDTEPDKETIMMLNTLQKDASKIYENYENAKAKFLEEKKQGKVRNSSQRLSQKEIRELKKK